MFEKLSDTLNMLMAKARMNASELARQTGLPASTIKKIRNNDNPNPTLTTLIPLAKYFSVTLSQLIGEETFSDFPLSKLTPKNVEIRNQIPLLSWQEASTWPFNKNYALSSFITVENRYGENTYALSVEENDWEGLPRGAILIIDPTSTIEHRDFVIVLKEDQVIPTLKQILFDEGQIYLKPIIQGYPISTFTTQHKFLGVMMENRNQIKKSNNNESLIKSIK